MSEIFFIADTHFGHRRIIEFDETRPFRSFPSIEEHDEGLVRRWNSVVGPKDVVWHLGDFCFGKRNLEIAALLNGNKKLVMGNHDMYTSADYLRYFTRLSGAVEFKGAVLTHVPIHESQMERWAFNVHGHLHTKRAMRPPTLQLDGTIMEGVPDWRYVCVSAEQVDLTPVTFDWILEKRKEAK
ncbi:MAG: hypothetical protein BGO49_24355 [Planctomycetales bacterium 71-10]|nr:MAG: hypothetical protein BGO49_24355 [Planctomycetales bacterium 71-10]